MVWEAIALGSAAAGAGFVARAAAWPAARTWTRGFHRGPRQGSLLALTFDDGPSESTPEILDVLEGAGARATFFACGRNVERLPAVGRRILEAGHEIANHTLGHRLLLGLSRRAVEDEVAQAQRVIADVLGERPRLFRPPFGVRSPWLGGVLERMGLIEVHWSVIGHDWRLPAERIASRVLGGVDSGGVVCLHDGWELRPGDHRRATAAALRSILPILHDQGFSLVTAGEMGAALEAAPAGRRSP